MQQELLAPLVLQVQPALKVFKASQVWQVNLVQQALQAHKEKEVLQVLQELLAPLVLQAQPALKVFKASQVWQVKLVQQALQAHKEKEVLRVL